MPASTPFFFFVPVSLGVSGLVSSERVKKKREKRETKTKSFKFYIFIE